MPFTGNVRVVGNAPQSIYTGSSDSPGVLIVNLDLTNTCYVGADVFTSSSGVQIPPLGSVSLDGTETIFAICPTGQIQLQVIPGGQQWSPSAQQIAEQIAILGINVTVSINTIPPSGDDTGTTDTAKWLTGLADGNSIQLEPNSVYYILADQIILKPGTVLPQEIFGNGAVIYQVGSAGATITIESTGTINASVRCALHDMAIRGDKAASTAVGVQYGDVEQVWFDNVSILKFTSGAAFAAVNDVGWTEQTHGDVYIDNCLYGFQFVGGSSNSFDRMDLRVWVNLQANQQAVQFKSGGQCTHGSLQIRGNVASGSGNTGIVLGFADTTCNWNQGRLDIAVEQDGSSGTGFQTIYFNSSSNYIKRSFGQLCFLNGTVSFQESNSSYNLGPFNGYIVGDNSLIDTSGGGYDQHINSGFPSGITGNIYFKLTPDADLAFVYWDLAISSGTTLNFAESLGTMNAPIYPSVPKNIIGTIVTPGTSSAQYSNLSLGDAGAVEFGGSSVTVGANSIFTGQGTYSLSL
jgi:hypothetical protein